MIHLNWDCCQLGHLCNLSSQSVLLWDCNNDAAIQKLNLSQVGRITEVPGLIICCVVSAVMGRVRRKCYWEPKCDIENNPRNAEGSYLGEWEKTKVQSVSESWLALLYKRTSKERRKENHPMPPTLSLYTTCLPPFNHSSSSDVLSESHPTILHTTTVTPYQYNLATSSDITTPQTTFLWYQIIPPPSHRILCVF